jgi:hypothetical protein
MADIVGSLFGVNVGELQNRQYQNDQNMAFAISNAYKRPGNRIGALVGANIGQGLARGLFNIQDPMINKAKQFEEILIQTQNQVGDNPVELYKTLAKNLGEAGFGREAQQALQQGIQLEQTSALNAAKIASDNSTVVKNYAQATKAGYEKAPEVVRLIEARDAYLESGNQEGARYVQNVIDKLGTIPEKVLSPDNAAKQSVLSDFIEQFGPTEGARKFLDYENEQKQKVSSVQGTGELITNYNGDVIGKTTKKGDVILENGQIVPQKEYSEYSKEQEAANALLYRLDTIDADTVDTAFSRLIDTTGEDALSKGYALSHPEINKAQLAIQGLRVKEILNNLESLTGVASDKDMAVVTATFPGFSASAQTMKDWIVRARVATVNFMQRRANKYGFEPPQFDFSEFASSPVFQGASQKEKEKAFKVLSKIPEVWGQVNENEAVKALGTGAKGASEIKTSDGKTEFRFRGQTFVRPPHATDDSWNKYKAYITSGGN